MQFVVIALVADTRARSSPETIGAFGTPTVVHFCAVLLISAIMSAPWIRISSAGIAVGACGVGGVGYAAMVSIQLRRQTAYVPVLEDWIWHCALPLVAYTALLPAAVVIRSQTGPSLFTIGAAALLMLFVGIHNAWDSVTYIALQRNREPHEKGDPERLDRKP